MSAAWIPVEEIYSILDLKRHVVGVRFIHEKEDFENEDAVEAKRFFRYCVLIRSASLNHPVKVKGSEFACNGSTRTLGFEMKPEKNISGRHGHALGLYETISIAYKASLDISSLEHSPYGVVAKPVEMFTGSNPDIVIIVTTPYNIMRIVQGYTYKYGIKPDFKLSGNQALCFECTTKPFMTNDINISVLCSGTRHHARWDETEMAIGIPYHQYNRIIEGVIDTINTTEPDYKKEIMIKNLNKKNIDSSNVKPGTGYFVGQRNSKSSVNCKISYHD